MKIKIALLTFTFACARSIYSDTIFGTNISTYEANYEPTNEFNELALELALSRSARDLIGYNRLQNIANNVDLSPKENRQLETYNTQIAKYITKNANNDILKRFRAKLTAHRASRRIRMLKNAGYA